MPCSRPSGRVLHETLPDGPVFGLKTLVLGTVRQRNAPNSACRSQIRWLHFLFRGRLGEMSDRIWHDERADRIGHDENPDQVGCDERADRDK